MNETGAMLSNFTDSRSIKFLKQFLQKFSDLVAQNHTLDLYCIRCDRRHVTDLNRLIGAGIDKPITEARFRCRDCREIVEKQIRPPVPTLGEAVAYI